VHFSPQEHLPFAQFPQPSAWLALQVVQVQSEPHLQLSPQLHFEAHAAQVIIVGVQSVGHLHINSTACFLGQIC